MKARVVIVDDEPITRMDFCQVLTAAQYEVVGQAKDGFEAVECCRALRPDIVVMDVKMPVFGGLGAAETIIQEDLCPCVVLVTAYSDEEIIRRAERVGVMAYLVKPISEKELIPAISVALSRSREIARMKAEMEQISKNARESKLIEQAKGILARMQGVSETEAFAVLRKMSMDKRCPISQIAAYIVEENSERAAIGKAKALLMEKRGLSEAAAYTALKKAAKDGGISLRRAAELVLQGGS